MTPIDLKNCTLFLIDGTGANFIAIRIGEGNFSYTNRRNIETKKSRGNLDKIREGEEEPVDISFQFVWDCIESDAEEPPTLEEVLYGEAEGWTSAATDLAGPFSVNIQIVRSLTCRAPNGVDVALIETYNFPEFNFTELAHDIKQATVDCTGISNRVKPHVVRS